MVNIFGFAQGLHDERFCSVTKASTAFSDKIIIVAEALQAMAFIFYAKGSVLFRLPAE